MNYLDHSKLSSIKFGGHESDYIEIHKFLDSSKLYYYHVKHRLLLHNLFGVELCVDIFGDVLITDCGKEVVVRDVAVEHCQEDLNGKVPTINDWMYGFDYNYTEDMYLKILSLDSKSMKEFMLRPYILSNLKTSLLITDSNFGAHIAQKIFGVNEVMKAKEIGLFSNLTENWLAKFKFSNSWQFTPRASDLKLLEEYESKKNFAADNTITS